MKNRIDISEMEFENLDFTESKVLFNRRLIDSDNISIYVWGVTIPAECCGYLNINEGNSNEDLYLSGFGKLVLSKVSSIDIEMDLMECDELYKFKKYGGTNRYSHINNSMNEGVSDDYVYEFDTTFILPFGRGDIQIKARGQVTFEFETDDLILLKEYCRNPLKYTPF